MDQHFEREMCITHKEFFRLLPIALKDIQYQMNDNKITISAYDGDIEITLGQQGERRIAALILPKAKVSYDFKGISESNIQLFLDNFSRAYQRGGG